MPGVKVLLEVKSAQKDPFSFHAAALASPAEAHRQAEAALTSLGGLGIELDEDVAPVPMFSDTGGPASALREFAGVAAKPRKGPTKASSMVVPAEVSRARMKELQESDKVTVWPNSEMVLLAEGDGVVDDASSHGVGAGRSARASRSRSSGRCWVSRASGPTASADRTWSSASSTRA
jgi:hypothetical protein